MLTDPFFHEFFQAVPNLVRDLAELDSQHEYRFASEIVKTPTNQIDGVFRPSHPEDPIIFLEAQGYLDKFIYLRALSETFTLLNKEGYEGTFIMVLLFVEAKYDPGNCPIDLKAPNRLLRINLRDFLDRMEPHPGAWSVLKSLFYEDESTLPNAAKEWRSEIVSSQISRKAEMALLKLMIAIIGERFKHLSREEIMEAVRMPALKDTRIAREFAAEGERRGEWIGKIHAAQEFLELPVTPKVELADLPIEELQQIYETLKMRR